MGTRSQVHMVNSGVYLYQYWDGYDLPQEIQTALKNKARWDNEEYLTRIIFDTMVDAGKYEGWDETETEKQRHQSTGYGIGTCQHGDIEWLVEVNVESQKITVRQGYKSLEAVWSGSFEEFIQTNVDEKYLLVGCRY